MANEQSDIQSLAEAFGRGDTTTVRLALAAPLEQPGGAVWLRELNAVGVLTQIMPELAAGHNLDQHNDHFLPVLEHCLETVTAVTWLECELHGITLPPEQRPVAVQRFPQLRWRTRYAGAFRERFATRFASGRTVGAMFKLAALLHDNGKPATMQFKPNGRSSFYDHQVVGAETTEQIAQRLQFPPPEVEYLRVVVREHMRPGQLDANGTVTRRALRRLFAATGPAAPDVLLHAMADHLATRGPTIDAEAWFTHVRWTDTMLGALWGPKKEEPPVLLDGDQLMAVLGLEPGPLVGTLLDAVHAAQARGDISTNTEALALVQQLLRETSGASGACS